MEIEDYSNYLIYDDGRVFSKNKKDFLKLNYNNKGYLYVDLYKDKQWKKFLVHRLIATHYIPNPENKPCVDHIDRNPKNNTKNNLRWVDKSENGFNIDHQVNNKLKVKNVCFCNTYKKFKFSKRINGKDISKLFNTLEEAMSYASSYN